MIRSLVQHNGWRRAYTGTHLDSVNRRLSPFEVTLPALECARVGHRLGGLAKLRSRCARSQISGYYHGNRRPQSVRSPARPRVIAWRRRVQVETLDLVGINGPPASKPTVPRSPIPTRWRRRFVSIAESVPRFENVPVCLPADPEYGARHGDFHAVARKFARAPVHGDPPEHAASVRDGRCPTAMHAGDPT